VRNPLDSADSLFTAGSELAHKIGLVSEIASDLDSFIASRGYQSVGMFAPDFGDHVIAFLNGFAVRGILTTVLLISLYMTFSSPGQGLPEVAAVVSLAVLFGVPLLTGYAGWIEIVAVVLGLVLIAVEIFVLPGFGLPGITGLLLVIGALVMTFAPPISLPDAPGGFAMPWSQLLRGLVVVMIAMAASLLLWWWLSRFLPKMPYLNRLILTAGGPQPATAGAGGGTDAGIGIDEEPWPPVGAVGRALTDLRPGGSAEFHDHLINDVRLADVVCDCGFVAHGTAIKVREVHGNRIVVRPMS
jgi:membrane-bound serine protease (ClpP class)